MITQDGILDKLSEKDKSNFRILKIDFFDTFGKIKRRRIAILIF